MKSRIKSLVKSTLGCLGYQINALGSFPTTLTDKDVLQSLMQRLAPRSISNGLIRLGPNGDGGYLIPEDITGIEACFSPGVSTVSGFEKDCADLGMKVFMADKSVEKPAESHELFHFTSKFVGATTNDEFITLDDWVKASLEDSKSDLLLQIDIEGYEYETFLRMSDHLLGRFRIIVVEFHNLDQLWNKPFFTIASRAFDKILQTHTCVHIHPNNCCGIFENCGLPIPRVAEFTFLRNDRVGNYSYAKSFPHRLDCDNTEDPHLSLPECWYDF